MSEDLQKMETEADWQALFDEELTAAIATAAKILKEEEEKRRKAERIANAVIIPDDFIGRKPTMELEEVSLALWQAYGSSGISLTKKEGKYILNYGYAAVYSLENDRSKKELSQLEAVWVEEQVKNCLKLCDQTTWQSLAGGDRMSVSIRTRGNYHLEMNHEKPFRKYVDLKGELQKLASYGSFTETEAKKLNR